MTDDFRPWVRAPRASHDHLAATVDAIGAEGVAGPSYCSDWTVAQVLSHLGSGAVISLAGLEAALAGEAMPGQDANQPIWDRWNAMSPAEQAAEWRVADAAYVDALEATPDEALEALHVQLFGMELDVVGLLGLRLNEHAIHTWDVDVVGDPEATIQPDAASLVVDRFGLLVPDVARGPRPSGPVAVVTSAPERAFELEVGGDLVALTPRDAAAADATGRVLTTTADGLIRLVYGRLDDGHVPAGTAVEGDVTLESLRALFPGCDRPGTSPVTGQPAVISTTPSTVVTTPAICTRCSRSPWMKRASSAVTTG